MTKPTNPGVYVVTYFISGGYRRKGLALVSRGFNQHLVAAFVAVLDDNGEPVAEVLPTNYAPVVDWTDIISWEAMTPPPSGPERILGFYRGVAPHPDGMMFKDALYMPNEEWERCHNYVQWFFPLPEPSKMHFDAPVADDSVYEAFKSEPLLRANLVLAVGRYLKFLQECPKWVRRDDHNHLRITRVIRCMVLAGMVEDASRFLIEVLKTVDQHLTGQGVVEGPTDVARKFWVSALNPNPAWLKEGV